MGSIGMSRQGGIRLLETTWYNVLKAQSSPWGQLHLGEFGFRSFHCEVRSVEQRRYSNFIFAFPFINIYWSQRLLLRMSPYLWILMRMFLVYFCHRLRMCTLWRTCLQIWIRFRVKTLKS
jgi:hypothetical protein